MKTMKSLLTACLLLSIASGSYGQNFSSRSTPNQGKSEEKRSEVKTKESTEKRSVAPEKRSTVSETKSVTSDTRSSVSDTRNSDRRETSPNRQSNPQAFRITTRGGIRYDVYDRPSPDRVHSSREPQRYDRTSIRIDYRRGWNSDRHLYVRFGTYESRCPYCMGRGFTLLFNGLSRVRCSHCDGVGYHTRRSLWTNTCAHCYDYLPGTDRYYNLSERAALETDRLDARIDLSDRQWERIYAINYDFLLSRKMEDSYPISVRDQSIYEVLNRQQQDDFSFYLEHLRPEDLCIRCQRAYF
jgi:hypothetical protein